MFTLIPDIHLHNRVGAVLLRLAPFSQTLDELPCLLVYPVSVVVLYLEVVVGAVEVDHPLPAVHELPRATVHGRLNGVDMPRQFAQRPLHVVLPECGWKQHPLCELERPYLRARAEHPGERERPEDLIEVVPDAQVFLDISLCPQGCPVSSRLSMWVSR